VVVCVCVGFVICEDCVCGCVYLWVFNLWLCVCVGVCICGVCNVWVCVYVGVRMCEL